MGALPLLLLLFCCRLGIGAATDTISSSHFIKDLDTIVSNSSTFVMGFFSPVNSKKRYAGVWYNQSATNPIWVANRDRPLNDSSGIVRISEDGDLVVVNGLEEVLWSSNVSKVVGNSTAQLTNDGNLVLQDTSSGNIIWESFQHPANVLAANMKSVANKRTGEKTLQTSWSSASNPAVGSFSSGLNPLDIPEIFIWKGGRPIWRSGPWDGGVFNGVPKLGLVHLSGLRIVKDGNGTFTLSYTSDENSHLIVDLSPEGTLVGKRWVNKANVWINLSEAPESVCDFYGKCGISGSCSIQDSPICGCLRGFEPKNAEEWKIGNWTGGCVRRTLLQCDRIRNGGEVGKEDGFSKMELVKLPDLGSWSPHNESACGESCLNNCSCVAYAYPSGIGCMSWTGDLIDIQHFSSGGADLYIRLAYSELGGDNKNKKVIIIITTAILISIAIAVCAFSSWHWMSKYKVWKRNRKNLLHKSKAAYLTSEDGTILKNKMNQVELQEIPLFSLQMLVISTDNFAKSNKLGQGGFGPVFKGKLPDGQEIAIKRLSTASGQGVQEFMNEIEVISKLQHRNLVRLLGCCVEGEEKMLVYEYMPNKSLDAFLFGPRKEELLDWTRRFNIIEGICRGLLYLHRDSRLRIIHRDLKASNILLDHELNPKISDFGLAKIFEGNQDQAATRRVVGTFGYMAPEYAMDGRFSEKSDVFSFGVLLLEIVSGRRNTSFLGDEDGLSLLEYAWKLRNEDDIAALVDPAILGPCFRTEVLRCINVGLLCVQEFAGDRPSTSTVISMLNSEIVDLPTPRQPAFTGRRIALDTNALQNEQKCSVNDMTLSIPTGR